MTNRAIIALRRIDRQGVFSYLDGITSANQYDVDPEFENGEGIPSDGVQDLIAWGLVIVHTHYYDVGLVGSINFEITPKGALRLENLREILKWTD